MSTSHAVRKSIVPARTIRLQPASDTEFARLLRGELPPEQARACLARVRAAHLVADTDWCRCLSHRDAMVGAR